MKLPDSITRQRVIAPSIRTFFSKLGHMAMHYFWGAFAAGWNGAMTAVHGYIAMAVGNSLDPSNIAPPSLHSLGFFFSVRFVIDAVGYFKAHPLPEDLNVPADPKVPELTTAPTPRASTTTPPIIP